MGKQCTSPFSHCLKYQQLVHVFILNHKHELFGPYFLPSQFLYLVSPVNVKSDAVQFPSFTCITLFLGAASHQHFEPQAGAGRKKFATTILYTIFKILFLLHNCVL